MAGLTITFTEKPGDTHYTLAEINQLFADIAAVLNAKLDVRDPVAMANLVLNGHRVINLGDGVDGTDAITYRQFLELP